MWSYVPSTWFWNIIHFQTVDSEIKHDFLTLRESWNRSLSPHILRIVMSQEVLIGTSEHFFRNISIPEIRRKVIIFAHIQITMKFKWGETCTNQFRFFTWIRYWKGESHAILSFSQSKELILHLCHDSFHLHAGLDLSPNSCIFFDDD